MRGTGFYGKDLLCWDSWDGESIAAVLQIAEEMKRQWALNRTPDYLAGRTVHMVCFQEPSINGDTISAAVQQLGGVFIRIVPESLQNCGHSPTDIGKLMSHMGHALVCHHTEYGSGHRWTTDVAEQSTIPVIANQTDMYDPLQAIADVFTLREIFGPQLQNLKLALVWTPGREATRPLAAPHSLLQLAARFGMQVSIANPPEFPLMRKVVHQAKNYCQLSGGRVSRCDNMDEALDGAQVVVPMNWGSYGHFENWTGAPGQMEAMEKYRQCYDDWMLDQERLCLADFNARILRPVPFERDIAIESEVLDGPSSSVFQEHENRLHVSKALLALTVAGKS